jgi:DNA-binding response OmpR family regulator
MNLVVADDDGVFLTITNSVLRDSRYEVVSCEDGQEALDALTADDAPQIAILDWVMPKVDGLEVMEKLAELGKRDRCYILITSIRTQKAQIAQALLAGADDFLPKPLDETELLARIKVAERTVASRNLLENRLAEFEELARRHSLGGAMASRLFPATEAGEVLTPEENSLSPEISERAFFKTFADGLHEILAGLGCPVDGEPAGELARDYTLWIPLYLVGLNRWIDICLEIPEASAVALAKVIFDEENPKPRDILDTLAELTNLLQGAWRSRCENEGVASRIPIAPKARNLALPEAFAQSSEKRCRFNLAVGAFEAAVTILEKEVLVTEVVYTGLQKEQILVEALLSRDSEGMILVNENSELTPRHIDRIEEWVQSDAIENRFHVLEAPAESRQLAKTLTT